MENARCFSTPVSADDWTASEAEFWPASRLDVVVVASGFGAAKREAERTARVRENVGGGPLRMEEDAEVVVEAVREVVDEEEREMFEEVARAELDMGSGISSDPG